MNEFKDCYARLDGTRLIIGNAGIERVWDLQAGAPAAISIRDKQRGREWVWAAPYKDAFRRSALPLAGAPRVELQAGEDDEGGAAEPHLLVRAALTYQAALLAGRVYPIGEEPSGRAWTGFQSVTGPQTGYLIFFRELTDRPQAQFALRGAAPGAKLRLEKTSDQAQSDVQYWCAWRGLNPQPSAPEADTLSN